jgi:adenylosuccinate lyase
MAQTAATQWLERTLDDSAIRRLSLPQAFLAADGVLRLALNISKGLVVSPQVIARNVQDALPYVATENLLMAAVVRGADRQAAHERIRLHSRAVADQLKAGGKGNDLVERLRADPVFRGVDFDQLLEPANFVGRAPQQVAEFIEQEIVPIRLRYQHLLNQSVEVDV